MMRILAMVLFSFIFLAPAIVAREKESPEKLKFDLQYDYDPLELHEYWRKAIRWKQIIGPLGLAPYYIPAAHQPGLNLGPPRQLFGHGSGTTLWRDPITGWPLL